MARIGMLAGLKQELPSLQDLKDLAYAAGAGGLADLGSDMLLDRLPDMVSTGTGRTIAKILLGVGGGHLVRRHWNEAAGYGLAGAVGGSAVRELAEMVLGKAGLKGLADSDEELLNPSDLGDSAVEELEGFGLPGDPVQVLGESEVEQLGPGGFADYDEDESAAMAGYLT